MDSVCFRSNFWWPFLFVAILLAALRASADSWSHINLRSADQTSINVDYVPHFLSDTSHKPTNIYTADPIHINVMGSRLTGAQHVRVIVSNYEVTPENQWYLEAMYTLDLTWCGHHYTGELREAKLSRSHIPIDYKPMTIRRQGYGGITSFTQDLSVVVDGVWLQDPISQSHNFKFNLFSAAGNVPPVPQIIDQITGDIAVLKADAVRSIGTDTYGPHGCVAGECTREHATQFGAPALHEIDNVYDGTFFCHLLEVVTVSRAEALKHSEGIGFYYQGWNERGRFIPRERLVELGTVRLKSGETGVLHRFTGLANCWLGSAAKSTTAEYSFKPFMAFRTLDGKTRYRNWEKAENATISVERDHLDRTARLVR